MGLSEREQQLLDEMERRLYQSEADVVHTPSGVKRAINFRSLVLGIILALIGVGLLIGGVAAQQLWLGLIGFAAMLGGAVLASARGDITPEDVITAQQRASNGGLSERLNKRWDERMDGER